MAFWINSFKTPLLNHAVIKSDTNELFAAIGKWARSVKIILSIDPDWEYGIVVCTNNQADRTAKIKYAKNLKGNKFIDNDAIPNLPGDKEEGIFSFEDLGPVLGKEFVVLGYFDPDNYFAAVEVCDLVNSEGKRSYMKCDTDVIRALNVARFTVPSRIDWMVDGINNLHEVLLDDDYKRNVLIIPHAKQDQAILYKP